MKKEDYHLLHAGGSLVMGQEQDGKAIFEEGKEFYPFFDKQQSFSGQLTQVELWNTTLTALEIQKLATCEVSSLRPQNRVITWKSSAWKAIGKTHIKNVPLEELCEKNLIIDQFIWPREIDFTTFNSLCKTMNGMLSSLFSFNQSWRMNFYNHHIRRIFKSHSISVTFKFCAVLGAQGIRAMGFRRAQCNQH